MFLPACENSRDLHADIPEPVWAVGFALEQSLHVVALPYSALRILKRLEHIKVRLFVMIHFIIDRYDCKDCKKCTCL
ncbi:MAG: hypothetical protein LBK06_06395 [Planctomycetaceae bacterium]|nr:hypothetical protein [Planctomycetaceae bacterium]